MPDPRILRARLAAAEALNDALEILGTDDSLDADGLWIPREDVRPLTDALERIHAALQAIPVEPPPAVSVH